MTTIRDIADESWVKVISFLRALDIVSVIETNKNFLSKLNLERAIKFQLSETYGTVINAKNSRVFSVENLYIHEIKLILSALTSSKPSVGGYWVSASWLANAKKYYEALPLPNLEKEKGKGKKKALKIKQRRGSDSLPPWPQINAEITCEHGCLALSKSLRAKRRVLDKASWRVLRKFYPKGVEFKVTTLSSECQICTEQEMLTKLEETKRMEMATKSIRKVELNEVLVSLVNRKSGVPADCLQIRGGISSPITNPFSTSPTSVTDIIPQPLIPGLYHLIPKEWLKTWRVSLKESLPPVCAVTPLDCTSLLCYSHGLLMVPPHVEEYLVFGRKNLLQGLGEYPGLLYEIVTDQEWDALQATCGMVDFNVRFTCDGESVQWSLDRCSLCAPFQTH